MARCALTSFYPTGARASLPPLHHRKTLPYTKMERSIDRKRRWARNHQWDTYVGPIAFIDKGGMRPTCAWNKVDLGNFRCCSETGRPAVRHPRWRTLHLRWMLGTPFNVLLVVTGSVQAECSAEDLAGAVGSNSEMGRSSRTSA